MSSDMARGPRFKIHPLCTLVVLTLVTVMNSHGYAQTIPSAHTPTTITTLPAASPAPSATPLPGASPVPAGKADASATTTDGNAEAPPVTRKTAWVAHVLRRTPINLRLKTMEFSDTKLPVLLIARPGSLRPLVEVRGKFNRRGWTLFAQGSPVSQAVGRADFKFHAFLNGRINEIILTARGPAGESEEERVYLFAPEAQEFTLVSPWNSVILSAGFSSIDYFQSGFGNYLAYTGTISARYATFDGPKQLGLYASLDFTALTLAAQPIDRGPQFIEGKLDATITLPFAAQQTWKTQILLGGSYVTMLANGSPFGFANLISPEVGLRTRFILDPTEAIITDLRYVALGKEFGAFSENGFLANITWSRTLLNSHRAELGINYTSYSYHPDTNSTVKFSIVSLMFGYSI